MRVLGKSARVALVSAVALLAGIGVANATPQTIGQTGGVYNVETGAVNSSNGTAVNYQSSLFNGGVVAGQGYGQVLEDSPFSNPYLTDGITVNRVNATTMTITMNTLFDGIESVGSTNVHYADLFITERSSTTPDQPNTNWAYGIGLGGAITNTGAVAGAGGEGLNGGAAAGVYQLGTGTGNTADYKTSKQVWNGVGGFYIGGDVSTTANVNAGNATKFDAPTQIVKPAVSDTTTLLNSLHVSVAQTNTGSALGVNGQTITGADFYNVTVTITDVTGGAALNSLFTNFDLFWGTGDCSNDAIWGNVTQAGVPLPAPGALLLLGFGLVGIGLMRRRSAGGFAI